MIFSLGLALPGVSCKPKKRYSLSSESSSLDSGTATSSYTALPASFTEDPGNAREAQPRTVSATTALPDAALLPHTAKVHDLITKNAASRSDDFTPYNLKISQSDQSVEMVPIPAGEFMFGQGPDNPGKKVKISAFWISRSEIPWALYRYFMENGRPRHKDGTLMELRPSDRLCDVVSQPTATYTSMTFGMGNGYEKDFPAVGMSRYAASKFCEWLSAQTGQYYRLPTEAEWEYACRAGSSQNWSFGDNEEQLGRNAWYYENANDQYQRIARKKANAFGLFDMHGNVAEWVLDSWNPKQLEQLLDGQKDPVYLDWQNKSGGILRGGSWDDDAPATTSRARKPSTPALNMRDPQNPKSIWYLTDGATVGFRIVRPLEIPGVEQMHTWWNAAKACP